MSARDEIARLVRKYVAQDALYREANRVVLKHKKLQEQIKNLFAQYAMEEFVLRGDGYDATLSFRAVKSMRIDPALIPDDLRSRYTREYISRKESLQIRQVPENK